MKLYQPQGTKNWAVTFYDENGKRVRKSLGTPDKARAEAWVRKKENEQFLQEHFDRTPDYPFADALVRYLKGDSTKKRSHDCDLSMSRNLRPHFGGKTLRAITTPLISEYVEKRRGQGVSDPTIKRDLSLLGVVLRKAHREWGWLDKVPPFPALKENPARIRWLTVEEMERLISCCPDHLRPIVITAFDTGGRITNVLGLRWPQVDFERRVVRFLRTKNERPVSVPMTSRLVAVLSSLKAAYDEAKKKAEAEPGSIVVPCVFTYRGQPIQSIKKSFATACEQAKIEDFRIHDMRHTFASHLVQNGVPLLAVKELLGHKTLAMVMRYAHLAPDNLRSAVEKLPGHSLGIVPAQTTGGSVATD